jgi:4-hydroxybenzoate polyprenyltransferase
MTISSGCSELNATRPTLTDQLVLMGRLVKFSHSIFALPFALAMMFIVARDRSISLVQIVLLLLALISARTAAMAFNRFLDRHIDGANPRTKDREIPSGLVSTRSVLAVITGSSLLFLLCALGLGIHCAQLAPLVLGILFFYSYTKRFTASSHIVLGLCLGMAPGGVWFALTEDYSWIPVPLMAAVLCWVAGFDILYSCQDVEFDRKTGLFSVPSRLGKSRAFMLSRLLHCLAFVLLLVFGSMASLGSFYYVGILIFAGFLIRQHLLVSPENLDRIDAAFFTSNGIASFVFLIAVVLDTAIY